MNRYSNMVYNYCGRSGLKLPAISLGLWHNFGTVDVYSNMQEMAAMSLYDTGVTAQYGDRLLTLSTCDYQETDGRFVVVAKKSQ